MVSQFDRLLQQAFTFFLSDMFQHYYNRSRLLTLTWTRPRHLHVSTSSVCDDAIYRCLFMHLNTFLAVHLLKIIARLHTNATLERKMANIFRFNFFFLLLVCYSECVFHRL